MSRKRSRGRKAMPQAERPLSEAAALVLGCCEDRSSLPILLDWLEERLGLGAMAWLFRQPGLAEVPEGWAGHCRAGDLTPLAVDVLLWVTWFSLPLAPGAADPTPGLALTLYAHPEGRPESWARFTHLLVLGPGMDRRAETARAELQAFSERQRGGR
jgi:hypothetical protein